MVRVVATVEIPGFGTVEFTSEPLNENDANILLWLLSDGPFKVEKARIKRGDE